MFGRKAVFLAGTAAFAAGSALSGAAGDEVVLVAGRSIQGLGAAAMLPLSLAIVCDAFPRSEQPKALGIWAGVSAVALAVGPLLGGLLVAIDWRVIFWINLPVAALGFVIMARVARESTDPEAGHEIDYPGLAALTTGMVAAVLAIVQSQAWGWDSPATLGLLVAGTGALAAFWVIEHRSGHPIVDFSLFHNGPYFGASAAAFALVGAYWTVMFYQPQYLQDVLGHSAIEAGLLILPVTLPMVFFSPMSGRLIARFGARGLMTAGMLCGLAGLLVLTRIEDDTPYALLLAGYLLFGIALGLVYAPMSTAAMAAMPADKAGIASGVLAMDRVLAGAVALAVSGAVFASLETSKLDGHEADRGVAFSYAVAGSTWVLVGLLAVGAILTYAYVRDPEPPEQAHVTEKPDLHQHHRKFHLP
jgi:EmrB/QacA subfamily drug resistance transporter